MVDDLTDRLARYRADLDAAVLADLKRRRAAPAGMGVSSGHAGIGVTSRVASPFGSDNGDAAIAHRDAVDGAVDPPALELSTAQLPPRPSRPRIAARIVLVAASAAAVAATTAVLIDRDDTTAPASVPHPDVTVTSPPASSLATTSSPRSTTTTTTTTLTPVTVDDVLPAAGVALSSPETGELVAAVGKIHDGAWLLYADGRLISTDDHPIDDRRTVIGGGWLEQRLTPDGVERVRAEFLASGLFDPSQQPSEVLSAHEDVAPSQRALVRDGDRLLIAPNSTDPPDSSLSSCPTDAPGTKCELIWYFRQLGSSLPQNEWADPQLRRYVPARYAICLIAAQGADGRAVALDELPSVLALLPSPTPQLLVGREPTLDYFEAANSCFDLTIFEARALATAFIDALPDRLYTNSPERASNLLGTGTQVQLGSTTVEVVIEIWPLLPAGGLAIWGG